MSIVNACVFGNNTYFISVKYSYINVLKSIYHDMLRYKLDYNIDLDEIIKSLDLKGIDENYRQKYIEEYDAINYNIKYNIDNKYYIVVLKNNTTKTNSNELNNAEYECYQKKEKTFTKIDNAEISNNIINLINKDDNLIDIGNINNDNVDVNEFVHFIIWYKKYNRFIDDNDELNNELIAIRTDLANKIDIGNKNIKDIQKNYENLCNKYSNKDNLNRAFLKILYQLYLPEHNKCIFGNNYIKLKFNIKDSDIIYSSIVNNTQFRGIVQHVSYIVYGYGEYTVFNALNPNFDQLLNSYGHIITKTDIFEDKIPEIKIQHFNSLMILLDANFIGIIRSILYKATQKELEGKNIHEIIKIIMDLLQCILNFKRLGIRTEINEDKDLKLAYKLFMKYAVNLSKENSFVDGEIIDYDKLFKYLLYYSNTYNYMLPLLTVKINYADEINEKNKEIKDIFVNGQSISYVYSKIKDIIEKYFMKDKDNIIIKESVKLMRAKNIRRMGFKEQFNELVNAISVFNFIYLKHNNKSTEPFIECTLNANYFKQKNSVSFYPLSNKFYIDLIYVKMFMPSEGSNIIIDYDVLKHIKYDDNNIDEYNNSREEILKYNNPEYNNNLYVFMHEDENKHYIGRSDSLLTLDEYRLMKDITDYKGYIKFNNNQLRYELSSDQNIN